MLREEDTMKKTAISLFALLATLALASSAFAQIRMNEIRLDQTGTDVDEYIELSGPAGASLAGYALLIIGDTGSAGTCGVLEEVFDLSPYSIQADGFLAIVDGDGAPTLSGYDVVLGAGTLNFENSDNVTYMLVTGFSGTDGSDLDTNDDGVLDSTPWASLVDHVGIFEGTVPNCTADEYLYSTNVVGPDGTFVPGHVFRCGNGWYIGPFDPLTGVDTPGSANDCATDVKSSSWGRLKSIYR
jgi:hypothetical protein